MSENNQELSAYEKEHFGKKVIKKIMLIFLQTLLD